MPIIFTFKDTREAFMLKKRSISYAVKTQSGAARHNARDRSSCTDLPYLRSAAFLASLVAAVFLLAAQSLAAQGERVALVIGNSDYEHVSKLTNPTNDAADISAALTRAGFSVETFYNLNQNDMLRALQAFGQRSIGAEMAVLYYAGHGIEVGRRNYLIPTSAALSTDLDVAFETVELDRTLLAVEGARRLRLVIIDACRDNPFANTMKQTSATRSIGRGLVAVEPSAATLVAYAAKEGTVANDGRGRNSPYAAALLDVLDEPGVEIGKLFRRVRDQVLRDTNGNQEPFVYGSVPAEDLYLYPAALQVAPATKPVLVSPSSVPAPSNSSIELAFWDAISGSSDPRDFQEFRDRFPNSVFAGLAQRRLEALTDQESDAPPFPASPEQDRIASSSPQPVLPPLVEPEVELTRDLVRSVQAQLNALGYGTGSPDGIVGRKTRGGVSEFQVASGLPGNGEITAGLLRKLNFEVSADRAFVDHYVVERFGVSTSSGRLKGLYCLENADLTLADGREGRDMLCHYIRPSRGQIELTSYYTHVRLENSAPIVGIVTRLWPRNDGSFVGDNGTRFLVDANRIEMGPNIFQRVK